MSFKQTYNYNRLNNKYPFPSSTVNHTVAFCEICECQRTFSYGFCDSCNSNYIPLEKHVHYCEFIKFDKNKIICKDCDHYDNCKDSINNSKACLSVPGPVSKVFSVKGILIHGSSCVEEPVKEMVI